jgi:hypothetical protein
MAKSLAIVTPQFKKIMLTSIKYHSYPLRGYEKKKKRKKTRDQKSPGEDGEKLEHLCTVGGKGKCAAAMETVWQILKTELQDDPARIESRILNKDILHPCSWHYLQ